MTKNIEKMIEQTREKMLEDYKIWLNSEKGQSHMEQQVRDLKQKRQETLDFFESAAFEEILNAFESVEQTVVDDATWMYHGSYEFISEIEYHRLWSSIWASLPANIIEDENSVFPSYTLNYRHYTLTLMHGQGSVSSLIKNTQEA